MHLFPSALDYVCEQLLKVLALTSLCDGPETHRDLLASAFRVLELKVCITTPNSQDVIPEMVTCLVQLTHVTRAVVP